MTIPVDIWNELQFIFIQNNLILPLSFLTKPRCLESLFSDVVHGIAQLIVSNYILYCSVHVTNVLYCTALCIFYGALCT